MTAIAILLALKQQLLERLQEGPGPHERDDILQRLAVIDQTLNKIEDVEPGAAKPSVSTGPQHEPPFSKSG